MEAPCSKTSTGEVLLFTVLSLPTVLNSTPLARRPRAGYYPSTPRARGRPAAHDEPRGRRRVRLAGADAHGRDVAAERLEGVAAARHLAGPAVSQRPAGLCAGGRGWEGAAAAQLARRWWRLARRADDALVAAPKGESSDLSSVSSAVTSALTQQQPRPLKGRPRQQRGSVHRPRLRSGLLVGRGPSGARLGALCRRRERVAWCAGSRPTTSSWARPRTRRSRRASYSGAVHATMRDASSSEDL